MPRAATGSIVYVPANSKTEGHYKVYLTLADGCRHWYHFPPCEQSAKNDKAFRQRAAELSEMVRSKGLTKADVSGKRDPVEQATVKGKGETVTEYTKRWIESRKTKGLRDINNDEGRLNAHALHVELPHRGGAKFGDLEIREVDEPSQEGAARHAAR